MPEAATQRHARLTLAKSDSGQSITAHLPSEISPEDFTRVTKTAYDLIHRLTGCNCLSGRISFVAEEMYSEVINVNLGPAQASHGAAQASHGAAQASA